MRCWIMKWKNYEPIKFLFFQDDMEKIMFTLQKAIRFYEMQSYLEKSKNDVDNYNSLVNIKADLQHKINIHRREGDWK